MKQDALDFLESHKKMNISTPDTVLTVNVRNMFLCILQKWHLT